MECLFCREGPAQRVSLFRINGKGQKGVWACSKHIKQTDASVSSDVRAITDALSPDAPAEGGAE